ncbi:MAG: response regulator transcription factor [Dehalococcoidia bacterium]
MNASNDQLISVLLADRRDVSDAGVEALLRSDRRFSVLAAVRSCSVLSLDERLLPTLLVFDPRIEGNLDWGLIADARRKFSGSRLCIHTTLVDPNSFFGVIEAGALAYLLKGSLGDGALLDALALVARTGGTFIVPAVRAAHQRPGMPKFALSPPEPDPQIFSEREREVLTLVPQGLTDHEVGDRLHITASTVATHMHSVVTKLGATTRSQAIAVAVRLGII